MQILLTTSQVQAIVSQKYWFLFTILPDYLGVFLFYILQKINEDLFFLICDKPNIYTVPRLGKFAFVQEEIVNINQIIEVNSRVSL